jgi:uncharacterized RDD family membrane protein YckC
MTLPADVQGRPAGFISRFIAFTVDLVIITLIGIAVSAFFGLVISFFGLNVVTDRMLGSLIQTMQAVVLTAGALFTTFFGLVYFLVFWMAAGVTPGKGLMGLRVVRYAGGPIKLSTALIRFLGYWVSGLFLFLGFLWVIIDARHQGWHDKMSGTLVVYTWHSTPSPR